MFKKGMKLHFIKDNRIEVIEKGSSNFVTGMLKTNRNEYSCDFILRWLHFGFVKLLYKNDAEVEVKSQFETWS